MKAIKKFFKITFWTLFYLVLAIIVLLLALPLWIGPTVTTVANKVVPGIVKSDFALNEFGFNQYSGKLHVGKMHLANPEGFEKENCVELGTLDVDVDTPSCFSKKIVIENITLDGLTISTTMTGANFRQIAKNAQGDKAQTAEEPKQAPEAETAKPEAKDVAKEEPAAEEAKEDNAKKVAIAKLVLKNITIKLNGMPIPIPEIDIDGIGMDDPEGTSFQEAAQVIFDKVMEKATALGGAVLDLGNAALDAGTEAATKALEVGSEAATKALDAVKNVDVSGATEAIGEGAGNALKAAGNLGSSAAGAIGEGAGSALKTAGNLGSGAASAVGDGAGAAVDAVKDVGGAAVNSIKGLFK